MLKMKILFSSHYWPWFLLRTSRVWLGNRKNVWHAKSKSLFRRISLTNSQGPRVPREAVLVPIVSLPQSLEPLWRALQTAELASDGTASNLHCQMELGQEKGKIKINFYFKYEKELQFIGHLNIWKIHHRNDKDEESQVKIVSLSFVA